MCVCRKETIKIVFTIFYRLYFPLYPKETECISTVSFTIPNNSVCYLLFCFSDLLHSARSVHSRIMYNCHNKQLLFSVKIYSLKKTVSLLHRYTLSSVKDPVVLRLISFTYIINTELDISRKNVVTGITCWVVIQILCVRNFTFSTIWRHLNVGQCHVSNCLTPASHPGRFKSPSPCGTWEWSDTAAILSPSISIFRCL
jgi:hypothetical protein